METTTSLESLHKTNSVQADLITSLTEQLRLNKEERKVQDLTINTMKDEVGVLSAQVGTLHNLLVASTISKYVSVDYTVTLKEPKGKVERIGFPKNVHAAPYSYNVTIKGPTSKMTPSALHMEFYCGDVAIPLEEYARVKFETMSFCPDSATTSITFRLTFNVCSHRNGGKFFAVEFYNVNEIEPLVYRSIPFGIHTRKIGKTEFEVDPFLFNGHREEATTQQMIWEGKQPLFKPDSIKDLYLTKGGYKEIRSVEILSDEKFPLFSTDTIGNVYSVIDVKPKRTSTGIAKHSTRSTKGAKKVPEMYVKDMEEIECGEEGFVTVEPVSIPLDEGCSKKRKNAPENSCVEEGFAIMTPFSIPLDEGCSKKRKYEPIFLCDVEIPCCLLDRIEDDISLFGLDPIFTLPSGSFPEIIDYL